jgi:hypothetical protein
MAYTPLPIINKIPADDVSSDALATRALPQAVDRVGFSKVISNNVDSEWGAIVGSIGSGMTVNQTGGNLVIAAGTTARSETIIRGLKSYEGSVRLRCRNTLSQRVANNNFFVELVDVIGDGLAYTISSATVLVVTIPSNPFTAENVGQSMYIGGFSGTGTFLSGRYPIASVAGNDVTFTVSAFAAGTGTCSAFGWNYYQLQYQGTTATQTNFDTQRKGWASGATTATINTTASPGHLAIVTGNDLVATFADQLVASGATIQQTVRASRVENVPDDTPLRLQIRIANGSTAPTATTWTIGLVSVSNYANQDVSIQDLRPMGVGSALPVEIMRGVALATQPVSGTVTANIGTGTLAAVTTAGTPAVPATPYFLNSAATTNGNLILTGTSGLQSFFATNIGATIAFVKLYNKATAPTVGTDTPEMIIAVPAAVAGVPGTATLPIGFNGFRFPLGLGIAITGLVADSDTTAVAAGQVKVKLSRTV